MADTAQGKIIDAFKALFEADSDLSGIGIITDRSPDEAIADEEIPCIVISTEAWGFQNDFSQGQTRHELLINFEYIESSANVGIIGRKAQEVIAYMLAAIGSDPTLGGRLEDFDERDVAPPMDNGKSIGGSSLQGLCTFYTPRRDHFTIVGVGGATF
ncbi:hypothetical protein [Novosphingobium sp. KN65.2]|uniref:hypothetical protein n=1 Tax=Novosphingobium sp. KN65.2 TaxID=1478134 RepID=UPI0006D54E76|nr:hypothetical protein [Novosphingobium sp. KN65.2]